jgi:hypothetical protein
MQPTATGGFALDLKIARLTASIEDGGALAPIVAKLRERQTERNVLLGEIGTAESMRTLTLDRQVIERKVLAKVARWSRCRPGGSSSVDSFSERCSTDRSTSSRRQRVSVQGNRPTRPRDF